MIDGWNAGDGSAFAAPFAEDADFIAFDGSHTKGQQAIAAAHQMLFETHLKGSKLTEGQIDVRFASPDVALVKAEGSTILPGKTVASPERSSIQTLTAVKRQGRWQFATFQNTRMRPMARSGGKAYPGTLVWLFSEWLWKVFVPGRTDPA